MSRERLEAVMAMPEAAGRRPLAEHLARKTTLSLAQVREHLAVAYADPVAVAQEILDAHRMRTDGKAPPSHVETTAEDVEAAKTSAEIVALTAHRRRPRAGKREG